MTSVPSGARGGWHGSAWVVLPLALALGFFAWRGPLRMMQGANDLAVILASTRAWLGGASPYELSSADAAFMEAGGPANIRPAARGAFDLLYPPSAFVALTPIGLLSWNGALMAWGVLNGAALGAGVWGIVRAAGWKWNERRSWLLLIIALAYAPVHTNFAHGQTGLMVFGLVASSCGARASGRAVLAGVLLGLAAGIKPQVAAVFLAYDMFRGRWRVVASSLVVLLALVAVGIGRMELAGVDWLSQYRANIAEFALTQNGNPTRSNPYRYQLLNLHYPLHTLFDSRTLVGAMVWGIVVVAGVAYLALRRRDEDRNDLIALTLASVASLLLVYHRFYDATLLLFAAALVLDRLPGLAWRVERGRAVSLIVIAACTAVLAAPGSAALFVLAREGRLPAWLTGSRAWETMIMPHQSWAILMLGVATLMWLWVSRPGRDHPRPAH